MKRKQTKAALSAVLGGIVGIVLWLAAWEWATTLGPVAAVSGIPTMSGSINQAMALATDPTFWSAIGETVAMALTGLLIALAVGLLVGV
ncbi:hypothetical protein [Arthrobacter sp. SD76]|uniref:hypothetical protein n=1 Tax=Arthrobacter sp. SD76 TaxID=3415007 RepID=UPI003C74F926